MKARVKEPEAIAEDWPLLPLIQGKRHGTCFITMEKMNI